LTAPAEKKPLVIVSALLALIALGVSIYLTVQSLTGGAVAGCGGGGGCSEVLSSAWSKVGPVPVSLFGIATYLVVLTGLALRLKTKGASKLGDAMLLFSVPTLLLAAAWFTGLQFVKIGALCPYCMAGHAIGTVLAVLLLLIAYDRSTFHSAIPVLVGISAASLFILVQTSPLNRQQPLIVENLFVGRDGEAWIDGERYVSMFGGELKFYLKDEPCLGEPDAKQVVAVAFDYACPHCRELHELLYDAVQQTPDRFVLVALPLSIHESVNPYTDDFSARFEDSYDRATLSLAVAQIDREKWVAFDRWLFSPGDDDAFPRSAAQAREQAQALVGEEALSRQMTGESLAALHQQIDRNIELLGLIPAQSRYVPVTSTPGASTHLTARYDDIQVLYDYLDAAAENAQPTP